MLENRSFDCMLGMLYPSDDKFDGLIGTEFNPWHKPDGSRQNIQVWKDPALDAKTVCVPDPDPGELFTDIHMQIYGLAANGTLDTGGPTMGGFVDNYMRQPPTIPATDPYLPEFCAQCVAQPSRWRESSPDGLCGCKFPAQRAFCEWCQIWRVHVLLTWRQAALARAMPGHEGIEDLIEEARR